MMRWATAHKRRASLKRPVCCPKHGVPFRGDGWERPGLARFRCPDPRCREVRRLEVEVDE